MPWVPASSVERQYREMQSLIYGPGIGEQLPTPKHYPIIKRKPQGGRVRLPDELTMRIFNFANRLNKTDGGVRTWKQIADDFNRINGTDFSPDGFQQQYNRAERHYDQLVIPHQLYATDILKWQEKREFPKRTT
jgi:hypothetical protein